MGVNVELRQHAPRPRKGRPQTTLVGEVPDGDDVFAGLLNRIFNGGRTPTLDRIDPFGQVTFSAGDAARLLAELEVAVKSVRTDTESAFLQQLERFARLCVANPRDHHLHFIGD